MCCADPFPLDLETAIEVLAEDEASRAALEQSIDEAQSGPYDICPPMAAVAMAPLAPAAGKGGGAAEAAGLRAAPRVEGGQGAGCERRRHGCLG